MSCDNKGAVETAFQLCAYFAVETERVRMNNIGCEIGEKLFAVVFYALVRRKNVEMFFSVG